MKILLCCPYKLDPRLGGAKVYLEAAEGYKRNNEDVTLLGVDDLDSNISSLNELQKLEQYSLVLKKYIQIHGNEYDVIEFEYPYLPFDRGDFPKRPLLIARSVLLWHHFKYIDIPIFPTVRGYLGKILKGAARKKELTFKLDQSVKTMMGADLVNVSNPDDKKILIEKFSIPAEKIVNFPYGLFNERRKVLEDSNIKSETCSNIVFIGTFDNRKGAVEFPKIVKHVLDRHPHLTFTMLGTSAMFPTKESVLKKFPNHTHSHLEIVTKFNPEDLPVLLSKSQLGLFPSYLEGFSFGILEMMSKGLPVVAYDTPGPSCVLPKSLLSKRGDWKSLADKICNLIENKNELNRVSRECKEISLQYNWEKITKDTLEFYKKFQSRKF